MDNELYSFALKSTLDEIRNLCPDIRNAFMFREDGEITVAEESTPRKTIVKIVDSFDGLMEKAEAMGGIELITVEGSKGGVNVSRMNNHYLVTVTSQNADKNYLNTVTHTLVKTVLKLLEKINPTPLNRGQGENNTLHYPSIVSSSEVQKRMVVEIKEYGSAEEIAETLDKEISETKSTLGEYLRRLDDIRALAEKSRKIHEVVMKLAGKKATSESLGEISIGSLNLVLDANPFHELTAIEQVVRSHQERLLVLQKAREALKWLDQLGDTEGLKYLVIQTDGVPERILFRIS